MNKFNEWANQQDWWKEDTRYVFARQFVTMIVAGMDAEEVITCLEKLKSAMAAEYGE